MLAASGPAQWARVPPAPTRTRRRRLWRPAQVSGIKTSDDRISFDVDRTGSPVLVKTVVLPQLAGHRGQWSLAGRAQPDGGHTGPVTHVSLHYYGSPPLWTGWAGP